MGCAKPSDDLGVGVKGLSRLGIAGSSRNSFRASLGIFHDAVEHWKEYLASGGYSYQTPNASWVISLESGGGG